MELLSQKRAREIGASLPRTMRRQIERETARDAGAAVSKIPFVGVRTDRGLKSLLRSAVREQQKKMEASNG